MASGRQVEYRLQLTSNAVGVLGQADAAANKFDNSMWQVQKTLASFGVGLGAHFLIDAAKNWTQAAADYEQAMLRIKNASQEGFGIFNQDFLNKQVDHFKIRLQDAADSYSKFLFFVKNTPYSNNQKNELFEELNIVGKVGGISQENMDATMNNISKLLTEGILEGRTLRNLSRVHPGIVPFLADAMGLKTGEKDAFARVMKEENEETMVQKLSQLISTGKLTKLHINSDILLEAFRNYAGGLQGKLPETLHTVQSELNDLSNTWERFKISMVLDEKPELINFFNSLKDSIKWLVDHEEGIIRTGRSIADAVKLYAEWRIALMAVQIPGAIIGFAANERDRFNNVFGIGGKEKEVAVNEEIIASEQVLAETNIELATSYDSLELQHLRYAESKFAESESIRLEIAELDKLKLSLEQVSVQMDLFSTQGLLFSDSELEMSSATKSSSETLALENEQMVLAERNRLALVEANMALAESQAFSNAAMAANPIGTTNLSMGLAGASMGMTGVGSGIMRGIGSAASASIMPVFIAGMALEVIDGLVPENRLTHKGLGISNWLNTSPLVQLGLLPSFGDGDSLIRYEEKIKANKQLQNDITASSFSSWSNLGGLSEGITKIDPKGNNLYNLLFAEQQNFDAKGLKYNILDLLLPLNDYGKRSEDNASVFGALKRAGINLPYYLDEGGFSTIPDYFHQHTAGTKGVNIGAAHPKHIRGNSSNYFTVHIQGGVNGMVNPVFKQVDGTTMTDVKQEVGLQIAAMLEDVINDVQVVK